MRFALEGFFLSDEFIEPLRKSKAPTARLEVQGYIPFCRHWRAVENLKLEDPEKFDLEDVPLVEGPDIDFWTQGRDGRTIHQTDIWWDTSLQFGAFEPEGLEIPYRIQGFYPTERARKAYLEQIDRQYERANKPLGAVPPEAEFDLSTMEDGWHLDFAGTARFGRVVCTVPVNTEDPEAFARRLVFQRLAYGGRLDGHVFGCEDRPPGEFAPDDGIFQDGRRVIFRPGN